MTRHARILKSYASGKAPQANVSAKNSDQSAGKAAADFVDARPSSISQRKLLPIIQRQAEVGRRPNQTGLPDALKTRIETLSGLSLDDVRVRYNSPKPARLDARAYTQGAEIHVAPGQERSLPHEAWHVVQQKQGRVRPTMSLNGTAVNNDATLEKEADVMGTPGSARQYDRTSAPRVSPAPMTFQRQIIQRQPKMGFEMEDADWRSWKKTWGIRSPYWRSSRDYKNCIPMTKREVLHQGTGFRLEADEFVDDGSLLSDIEFVTDPFPLTNAGYEGLKTALNEIGGIYDTITPLHGRNNATGEFIKNDESGFSDGSAMLSQGARTAKLKIQATQGFNLKDIPTVFRALSQHKSEADPEQAGLYAVLQHAMVGDKDASKDAVLAPLRDASERAWKITIAYLRKLDETVVEAFDLTEDEFSGLFGFLTAVIGFVRMMRNPKAIQGGAKTYTPMMHRNDFATMFGLLSPRLQALLRGDRQVFIDAIIAGVVADIDADDPMLNYDETAHRNEYVFKKFVLETGDRSRFFEPRTGLELSGYIAKKQVAYYVLPPSFTIQRWVTAWMDGQDPKDLLTKAHFEFAARNEIDENPVLDQNIQAVKDEIDPRIAALIDWGRCKYELGGVLLAFKYEALSGQQKEILTDYARGIGGLGEETDVDDPNLVLYENRDIAPDYLDEQNRALNPQGGGKLNIATARHTVLHYFLAMQGLFGRE